MNTKRRKADVRFPSSPLPSPVAHRNRSMAQLVFRSRKFPFKNYASGVGDLRCRGKATQIEAKQTCAVETRGEQGARQARRATYEARGRSGIIERRPSNAGPRNWMDRRLSPRSDSSMVQGNPSRAGGPRSSAVERVVTLPIGELARIGVPFFRLQLDVGRHE